MLKEHHYNHWFIMNKCNSRRECVGGFSHSTVSHFSDAVTTSLTGGILRVRDLDRAGAGFFHGFPVQPGAKLKRLFVLPPF